MFAYIIKFIIICAELTSDLLQGEPGKPGDKGATGPTGLRVSHNTPLHVAHW